MDPPAPASLVQIEAQRLDDPVGMWRASFETGVGITNPQLEGIRHCWTRDAREAADLVLSGDAKPVVVRHRQKMR
jgi:hypothetical protein